MSNLDSLTLSNRSPFNAAISDSGNASRGHLPALDGVRGIAVLMVFWFHLCQSNQELQQILPDVILRTASIGQTGVDLFFVLSGFLITRILLATRDHSARFRSFFARRSLRIFPLYFLFLAVGLLLPASWVSETGGSELSPFWMWCYLSNIPPTFWDRPVLFPHLWSLAVEEQFYLIWPFIVYWLPVNRTRDVCLLLFATAPVLRLVMMSNGYSPFYLLPCRVDALAAGAFLAVCWPADTNRKSYLPKVSVFVSVLLVVSAVCYIAFSGTGLPIVQVVKHSICSVLFSSLVYFAIEVQSIRSVLSSKCLRFFGKHSYAIYLCHPILIVTFRRLCLSSNSTTDIDLWAFVVLVITSTLGFSLLTWHFLEAPALSLKKHFEAKLR
jgi:peptidoglycan/LPS O-acetylase OafA/YrhL